LPEPEGDKSGLRALVVRPILPGKERAWDELMVTDHYLGFRQLLGEFLSVAPSPTPIVRYRVGMFRPLQKE